MKRAPRPCASLRAPPAPPTRQGAPPDGRDARRRARGAGGSGSSTLGTAAGLRRAQRRRRRPDRPAASRRTARGAARPDAERRRARATAGAARGARDASSDHDEREDGVELGHIDSPRRRRSGTHAWSARARVRAVRHDASTSAGRPPSSACRLPPAPRSSVTFLVLVHRHAPHPRCRGGGLEPAATSSEHCAAGCCQVDGPFDPLEGGTEK